MPQEQISNPAYPVLVRELVLSRPQLDMSLPAVLYWVDSTRTQARSSQLRTLGLAAGLMVVREREVREVGPELVIVLFLAFYSLRMHSDVKGLEVEYQRDVLSAECRQTRFSHFAEAVP